MSPLAHLRITVILTLTYQQHTHRIRNGIPRGSEITRNKVLGWTFNLVNQIELGIKTKELIIFLVDAEFSRLRYKIAQPEVAVIACAFFVIKLQGDFCSDAKSLVNFVKHKLALKMSDVWKYESIILINVPDYIAAMPGVMELMQATQTLIQIKIESQEELMELWHMIMETYIADIGSISSLHLMIVKTLIHSCCPESLLVFKLQSMELEAQSELLKSDTNRRALPQKHNLINEFEPFKSSQHSF